MAIEHDVHDALIGAGNQLKQDLWTKDDLAVLAQRAKDLVGLNAKAHDAADPGRKKQYQLAATLVLQHVQLLALTRLAVGQQHVLDALSDLFMKVLIPALLKYVPAALA